MINATFVFCDIVGFSRSDDDLQARLICELNAEVTHQLYHRLCEPERSVIFLPTGDGLVIVLLEKDNAPRRFLRKEVIDLVDRLMRFSLVMEGNKGLRIGVHLGPVWLIRDINGNLNVCGTAINDCQRIMDSAKANQVLISSSVYRILFGDSLEQYSLKFSNPVSIPVKHRLEVEVRVMFREGEPGWENTDPYPKGFLFGKKPRTQFIVKRLDELLEHPEKPLTIYEQSALSTFGIARRPAPGTLGGPPQPQWPDDEKDYVQLILEQKSKFRTLAEQERTTLKLILRPFRKYSPEWMKIRCETLLECLRSFRDSPNVDYVVVEDYEVPNRIIVKNGFSIEGYKMHDTSGYELSVIRNTTDEINEAIEAFEHVFKRERNNQDKDYVIDYFERLRESCLKQLEKS